MQLEVYRELPCGRFSFMAATDENGDHHFVTLDNWSDMLKVEPLRDWEEQSAESYRKAYVQGLAPHLYPVATSAYQILPPVPQQV